MCRIEFLVQNAIENWLLKITVSTIGPYISSQKNIIAPNNKTTIIHTGLTDQSKPANLLV
jgi:hypothetical protein